MNKNLLAVSQVGRPIYLDSFQSLTQSGQIDREKVAGRWKLETGRYGARNGELLIAGPDAKAPILSFDPQLKGSYTIFIGAYSPGNPGVSDPDSSRYGIYVRLKGDPHFTYLQLERAEPSYQEMYFTTVELNDRYIEVANFERNTALDYIKLVPVSRSTLPAPTGETIGILDFADDADVSEPPLFEAGSAIRNHADAGFDIVLRKAYAVRCKHHTRVGEQRASTPVKVWGQVWRYGSGIQAEVLAKDLYEQGVDGVTLYESNYAVFRPSLREQLWRFNRPECLRGF